MDDIEFSQQIYEEYLEKIEKDKQQLFEQLWDEMLNKSNNKSKDNKKEDS